MPIWHAGTEGVGILSDEERTAPLEAMGIARGAEDFIVEAVQKHGDELVIVSLGALTNVANAIRQVPSLKSRLARVFFMGGGVTFRRPVPEKLTTEDQYLADASHNVRCDVRAADEVFSSGIPMTIITNDVTTRVWWDGAPVRTLISATSPPEASLVGKLLDTWLDYRTGIFGRRITGTCPHDPLTIAEVMAPQFVTYARGRMTIHGDATTRFVPDEHGPHNVGVRVDADGFLKWFSQTILTAGTKLRDPGDV
jgi:purine nucleosidase